MTAETANTITTGLGGCLLQENWTCSLFRDALSESKRGIVKSMGGRCSSAIPDTKITTISDRGFRVQIKGVACQADASSHVPLIDLRKNARFSLFFGLFRVEPHGTWRATCRLAACSSRSRRRSGEKPVLNSKARGRAGLKNMR
jgi:hypothetical protein